MLPRLYPASHREKARVKTYCKCRYELVEDHPDWKRLRLCASCLKELNSWEVPSDVVNDRVADHALMMTILGARISDREKLKECQKEIKALRRALKEARCR